MSNYEYCLLRLIDGDANNNKEYEMEQISDTQFEARWGRIEQSKMSKRYSMSVWDKVRNQKLAKGYTDVTPLMTIQTKVSSQYKEIQNKAVKDLVADLLYYANEFVKQNYTISKDSVSAKQLTMAQSIIDSLSEVAEIKYLSAFNHRLQKLFTVIPRKMGNVQDYLAKSQKDFVPIMEREQETLNALKSVISVSEDDLTPDDRKTILEHFGISIRPCEEKEIAKIKEKLTSESDHLLDTAFRIEVKHLEEQHKDYMKANSLTRRNEHFLWHGTRNENVWGISKKGMLLNPKALITGKMFGYGLYFAPRAKKSIGYTSLRGSYWANGNSNKAYMFVMKVAYKKPYDVYSHQNAFCTFKEKDIKALGCDALYAHKGQMLVNDEIIVYNEAAVVPRYLLVLKG